MKCPCHSGKHYEECCFPYHLGEQLPNALALMRSRYSAYALCKADYIIATTHPEHVDASLSEAERKKHIESFSKNTRFEDLEIIEFVDAYPFSTVTFCARLSQNGKDATFTETSEFAQIEGRWFYRRALKID